jgi:protein-S-isoprenylcysteine O-methyltransferase Ste14
MLAGKLAIRSSGQPLTSSAVPFERLFVWLGGALFVASLAVSAHAYIFGWSQGTAPLAWRAIAVDATLVAAFASHHSLFARDGVKSRLARYVPERLQRSLYVWVASALWLGVIAWWQPVGGELFRHTGATAAAHVAIQLGGLWLIARSVGAIDGLELAGIRPSAFATRLQVRGPYRLVRHPLYLGWILIVFGAATMTGDRLAFAVMTTAYLVLAVPWEERSLERTFGDEYRSYKREVRWRLLPYVY